MVPKKNIPRNANQSSVELGHSAAENPEQEDVPTPSTDYVAVLSDLVTAQMQQFDAVDRRLRTELDLLLIELLPMRLIDATPECRVQELAAGLGLTVGGASKSVDRLERRGWVERAAHPRDRRSSILLLTQAGSEVLARGNHVASEEVEQRLRRALDATEIVAFSDALSQLRAANDDTRDDTTV